MIIRYKKHARERMFDRGISKELVRLAIQRGSKTKQRDGILASYSYIQVAYVKRDNVYWVKTVMVK